MADRAFVVTKRDQIRYSLICLACLFIIGLTDYLVPDREHLKPYCGKGLT
jgi:hypothetical protein